MFWAENIGTSEELKAWSSAPGLRIGNFEVYPLSLQSTIDLKLEENTFFTGSQILDGDIAAYIWRHMPEYDRSDPKHEQNQKRFVKRFAKETDPAGLIADIQAHIEAAFADATEPEPIAAIVAEFAQVYNLSPVDAAYTDLRIVFQTIRAIRAARRAIKANFLTTNN